jgi:hypothetical protein
VEGADRSEFGHHDELVAARHRLAGLAAELQERYAPPKPPSVTEPVGPAKPAEPPSRSAAPAARTFPVRGLGPPFTRTGGPHPYPPPPQPDPTHGFGR